MTKNAECYMVEWYTVDGKFVTTYFCTVTFARKFWTLTPGYVHLWDNPREGLLNFLQALPLNNVTIKEFPTK